MQGSVAPPDNEHELPGPLAVVDEASSADRPDSTSSKLSLAAKGKKRAREADNKVRSSSYPVARPDRAVLTTFARQLSPAPSTTTDSAAVLPRQSGTTRRIDRVVYAGYEIRALFGSPYPLDELPGAAVSAADKSTAVARDGRIHARDAGGKFGKKDKKGEAGKQGRAAQPLGGVSADERALALPVETAASPSGAQPASVENGGPDVARAVEPAATPSGADALAQSELAPPVASASDAILGSPVPLDEQLPVGSDSQLPPPTSVAALAENPPTAGPSTSLPIDPYPYSPSSTLSTPPALVDDVHPTASTSSANIRAERGKRGRFLPKPPGESVKSKRALERAARSSRPAPTSENGEPHLTQRQQRELARKAREEREREMAREGLERAGIEEVRLLVCDKCFKYMALPAVFAAHAVRSFSLSLFPSSYASCAGADLGALATQKECAVKQPPGRRVYQRGAISIWEVDGAVAKVRSFTCGSASTGISREPFLTTAFTRRRSSTARTCASSPSSSSSTSTCSSMCVRSPFLLPPASSARGADPASRRSRASRSTSSPRQWPSRSGSSDTSPRCVGCSLRLSSSVRACRASES